MTEQEMVNTHSPSWLLGFYWHWAVVSVTQPVDARYSHQLDSIPFECNTFRLPVFPFACDWGLLPPSGFNCHVHWAMKKLEYLSRPGAFFFIYIPHYAQHILVSWLKRSNGDFHQVASFKVRSHQNRFEDCHTAQASSACEK